MGALRTSEEGDDVVGGESTQAKSDDDRAIDAPGRIIIDSSVGAALPTATPPPVPRVRQPGPVAPQRASGIGLVIVVYILAAAALATAIYERFIA